MMLLDPYLSHPPIPQWMQSTSVGNISNVTNLQEISGMDCCRLTANAGLGVVVSDSPANVCTIINLATAATVGTITLTGAPTGAPSDWEELASCTIDGVAKWCVGDFGDNGSARASFNLIFFDETTFTGNHTLASLTVNCVFPAGNLPVSKDMEAMIFDAIDRKIYVITKRDATQKIYSLPYATSYVGTQTLTYEGTMTALPASRTVPLTTTDCYAVGATISPNFKEILVKNYSNVYFFPRNTLTQTVPQALNQSLVDVTAYCGGGSGSPKKSHPNAEPQGEAICYLIDGFDFVHASEYITTEGSSATQFPLFKCVRISAVPTQVTFQDGVSPTAGYAGTLDTYIWDTTPITTYGTLASMVCDCVGGGLQTDQRKSLLRFDISSIPSTARIVSVQLELYINTEGQGFAFYPMLVTWNESSTYTTLIGGADNDGTKAAIANDCINGVNLDTVVATVRNNMNLATVQAWVNGSMTNYGWLIESTDLAGGDGVQFDTRESVTASRRPKLIIKYT